MRFRIRPTSRFSFRLLNGERILPLVLAVSFIPDDNIYDYEYDGEFPTPTAKSDYLEGGAPADNDYTLIADGGDPSTELPS